MKLMKNHESKYEPRGDVGWVGMEMNHVAGFGGDDKSLWR